MLTSLAECRARYRRECGPRGGRGEERWSFVRYSFRVEVREREWIYFRKQANAIIFKEGLFLIRGYPAFNVLNLQRRQLANLYRTLQNTAIKQKL